MPTAAEASGTQSQIEAALDAGLDALSSEEKVQFQKFQKFQLEVDGTVYWVATGEMMVAQGSLHYATDRHQDEAETTGTNQVIFSSESEVTQFNLVEPLSMWIGSWPISVGPPLQVAFSARGNYFVQADVWHYSGWAVFPTLKAQVVNSAADVPAGPIVSNSLPIWLSYNAFAPVYPSFLVPDNAPPPYIAVHIDEESTISLAAAPLLGPWPGVTIPNSGASPLHELPVSVLARDRVKLTTYGFSNQMIWQYLAYLYEASVSDELFGFANSPVPTDAKRIQVEIAALAQKKSLVILANYYQGTADATARRLILEACVSSITILGGVQMGGTGESTQAEQIVSAQGSVFE